MLIVVFRINRARETAREAGKDDYQNVSVMNTNAMKFLPNYFVKVRPVSFKHDEWPRFLAFVPLSFCSGPIGEDVLPLPRRSEEHTSELQSLMRISYAVFCLKKKHKT